MPSFFPIKLKVLDESGLTVRELSGTGVTVKSIGPPLMLNSLWHPMIILISPFIIASKSVFE